MALYLSAFTHSFSLPVIPQADSQGLCSVAIRGRGSRVSLNAATSSANIQPSRVVTENKEYKITVAERFDRKEMPWKWFDICPLA